jgi:hypothetical protein
MTIEAKIALILVNAIAMLAVLHIEFVEIPQIEMSPISGDLEKNFMHLIAFLLILITVISLTNAFIY